MPYCFQHDPPKKLGRDAYGRYHCTYQCWKQGRADMQATIARNREKRLAEGAPSRHRTFPEPDDHPTVTERNWR